MRPAQHRQSVLQGGKPRTVLVHLYSPGCSRKTKRIITQVMSWKKVWFAIWPAWETFWARQCTWQAHQLSCVLHDTSQQDKGMAKRLKMKVKIFVKCVILDSGKKQTLGNT